MFQNVRYIFAVMLCIANMIIYGLKVNIAVAIIGMVKSSSSGTSGGIASFVECPEYLDNSTVAGGKSSEGPFEWTPSEQGWIISYYFVGYLVGMFPSGYFADRMNTKWVLLICVFFNAILTFVTPWVAQINLYALYTLRFFLGLVSSANLPIVNVLVGKWVVYEEKTTWVAIIYGGTSLGTVLSILSSGWIMDSWGWEWVFYIHGALPFFWVVLFAIFFADCPEEQRLISEGERELLVNSYGHRTPGSAKQKVPWRAIFTSVPFIALIFVNCLGNTVWYFLLTQMPKYMDKVLLYKITQNATITCLPYLLNVFMNTFIGKFLDFGRKRSWWSQTVARKIAVGFSCLPTCLFLLVIAYSGCERTLVTFLLCASIVASGAIFVGHLTNQNDLAPNYAGILMGITNTPGTIPAIVLPPLIGHLVGDLNTFARWRPIFWLNIIAQLLAFFIFLIFGSAKIQAWNYPEGKPPTIRVAK